ncbi:MAG: hypothetical protein HQK93_10795, partial [Nitrospirae bacterium]|nr:hypothetical protein [Nitrospirota bacterium]
MSENKTIYSKKLITLILASTLMFFTIVIWQSFKTLNDIKTIQLKYLRLEELIGIFSENDVILTM